MANCKVCILVLKLDFKNIFLNIHNFFIIFSSVPVEEVGKGSIERVAERSYVRDWVRLGLVHSSPASPNLHKDQFRVSTVNTSYMLCRTYVFL